MSSVRYLAGPPIVGEGLADPPANPDVRVVVAGLQGLDHSRDPGRGRAVGDGVNHITADACIGIPDQLEQPRPHPVVVGLDVAGAQVPARELANPALLAPRQLQQPIDSVLGRAPLTGRQADPYPLGDLAPPSHHPDGSGRHGRCRRGKRRNGLGNRIGCTLDDDPFSGYRWLLGYMGEGNLVVDGGHGGGLRGIGVHDRSGAWFAQRTWHWRDWPTELLAKRKRRIGARVSVVIPARDEERTVGKVVRSVRVALLERVGLVDEIVVIDSDSADGTAAAAKEAGATVYEARDIAPELGTYPGKGEALWKSLLVTSGDLLVFVDADLTLWGPHFVTGVLGPDRKSVV